MGIISVMKRIKWRNIAGLIIVMAAIIAVTSFISWLSYATEGECVQKGWLKACFWKDKSVSGHSETTEINFRLTNLGELTRSANVVMRVSPNLINLSSVEYYISALAPDESVKSSFRVQATGKRGHFKVGFDIDGDAIVDKEVYITVE